MYLLTSPQVKILWISNKINVTIIIPTSLVPPKRGQFHEFILMYPLLMQAFSNPFSQVPSNILFLSQLVHTCTTHSPKGPSFRSHSHMHPSCFSIPLSSIGAATPGISLTYYSYETPLTIYSTHPPQHLHLYKGHVYDPLYHPTF